ncbi:hypothetical protein [Microvirga lenta]|uniref:hypothetical protein n=1 Tax=Microvirga lenta TaxID=2881337 RepID=UPI001D000FB4|nr:hypothetical protein [Microvirga lenta]MCB5176298.1 hypothetical protein [Microvirga lenta]
MKTSAITDDVRQRAYDYYARHPKVSLGAIASFLGVSVWSFRRLRKSWGWPPRSEALNAEPPQSVPASPQNTLREAALSLAQVTRTRIDALVREQRADGADDHDRTARTLASYAKTLTAAQSLLEQEGSTLDGHGHTEKPPRSIHELRDELARHLERVIAEEEARGRDGLLV